jgi:hypothetical protein
MTETSPALDRAADLRRALEQTASALAGARLDDLLEAASAVEHALARLRAVPPGEDIDRRAVVTEADAARRALARCRRLGAALEDFVRLSFDARGQAVGYAPLQSVAETLTGRGLHARA